jgi:hypothetical protein
MDGQEYSNIYAIPANYTDSGRLFGGMLEVRNTVEAVIAAALIGYPILKWLHAPLSTKAILLAALLIPACVAALMGIGGDSLTQCAGYMAKFWTSRRVLHLRRIGYERGAKKQYRKK